MRRIVLPALLAALALPAPALAATPAAATAPELGAKLASCQTGAVAAQREVEFEAAMPATDGSSELAMRFDLEQRRTTTGAWKAVREVPGFGRYERSEPGAAGFVYRKRVERLALGSYRVVVRFRWSAADGAVLKRAVRRSAACRQPDLRADLSVVGVTTGDPLPGGRARYVVQLRNGGRTATVGAATVGLAVDGVELATLSLPGLAAGGVGSVAFEGPACRPGGAVVATADPGDALPEGRESDNALAVDCPA